MIGYIKAFAKWMVLAVVVGLLGGVIGSIFHMAIDIATEFRALNPWLIYLLPIGGLFIAGCYRLAKSKGHIDTNRVLDAARDDEKVPLVMAPLIAVGTAVTHLFGGSAGREGAALQLGGSIGYNVGKLFRLGKSDIHIIVMAGMSGVFAALFGTPVTAAFFSIEVISVGAMHYAAIVPCLMSALVASRIAVFMGLHPVRFELAAVEAISALSVSKVLILALLCAVVGIVFCVAIHKCDHLMDRFLPNSFVRVFAGGAIVVLITLIVGSYDYNGAGMDVITRAISGEAKWEAFILKILFTAITIAAGFKGGEIVPAFFVGSTFGCVMGMLLGITPGFAAAIGFIAVFCSVVNCPVASLILSVEVFGGEGFIFFAVACGVSYMMSGRFGLYKSQEFIYSKISDEPLN